MATIKTTSTILFAVLVIGLGHFASSYPPSCSHGFSPINGFINRLHRHLLSSPSALSFTLSFYVLHDLEDTTDEFQNLCINYEFESPDPVIALNKAIHFEFYYYSGDKSILNEIKENDPVGFNAYLRLNSVKKDDSDFMSRARTFRDTMRCRIRLQKWKKDLTAIPEDVRNQLGTEYASLTFDCVNYFIKMAARESNKKMYPIDTVVMDEFDSYTKWNTDDVQVFLGTFYRFHSSNPLNFHALCINYKARTGMVHVYDSGNPQKLEGRQKGIVEKLYPGRDIKYEEATALQGGNTTCGIFAITYAALLLNGKDPATYPIAHNKVYGDESIYMRLYILDMLSKGKLFLPN